MVNGNYVLYGDRPSSESEIVDDHVHSRNDRKTKRKNYRSANELQHTLNLAQLDNDTDSVKYEKRVKEPRLLRFVPNTDVEENFVSEKFETYDLKPTEERPRRYAFTKKPKNPADGSVNYAYSRSSSSCSSPNTNLPTISEHGEQHGMYQARAMASPKVNDLIAGYDTKLDKYFSKPRETKPFAFKGTHPDSLYRVPADGTGDGHKVTRVLRMLRWPVALIAVCVALAVFVYFLMPDNLDSGSNGNVTYWEPVVAGVGLRGNQNSQGSDQKDGTIKLGTKTSEIDFYDAANDKSILDSITEANIKRKLPIPPVFPTHLTPEVQYGNEKADSEKRTPKLLDDVSLEDDTTVKPHITQKPEKPLAIYFKESNDATTATTETITRAETINDFSNYDQKQTSKKVEDIPAKTYPSAYKEYVVQAPKHYTIQTGQDLYTAERDIIPESLYPPEDIYNRPTIGDNRPQFTSGHSKLFGISMEEAEKMSSTTQSALYNTRVSPTLPTWRDRDDSTTKKYPTNIYSDVQCRSTRSPLCRGVLPYDLAGAAAKIGDVEITSLTAQIDYLVATNCSDRVRHFVCALMEPECSPPPFPPKLPCYNLCKSIVDSCDGHIPRELTPAFHCKKYSQSNCVTARTPCYSREFTCGDGTCIPRDWICDGRSDCPTGEDEQRCVQCEPTDFKCPSGGCILKRWLCDGYMDCPEGEDESESICGARHVQVPADTHGDPGEESAGSAPAPAVRRPNKVPAPTRKHRTEHHKLRENESSKELLMTSDSNAFHLLRNYTPSPSRLTPYNRTSIRRPHPSHPKPKKVESVAIAPEEPEPVRPTSKKTDKNTKLKAKIGTPNESPEDVNLEDLGLFEEFEKEEKPVERKATNQRERGSHKHRSFGVPAPNPPVPDEELLIEDEPQEPKPKATMKLNKASNQFEKVVDGAALLRKASAAEAAELAEMEREAQAEANNTYVEKDELPNGDSSAGKQGWGRAHTSPCPSGELRCVDGRCITLAQLCDGTIDCTDHADEDNCYT